jgi:hypothetical protein
MSAHDVPFQRGIVMNNKGKFVLFVVGIISSLLFGAFAAAQTADNIANMEDLFGSWNVEVTTVNQGTTFPALFTLTADGGLIADEPPSPGETSGHGNWVRSGDGEAAYTFIALYSGEEGAYAGQLKVRGTLQFDSGSNSWSGPFAIDGFDASGELTFSDTGSFTLTRIEVEPLD